MNDEYLRMVLALPDEFFEGWEYNDGDIFWLIKDSDGDYTPSEDHGVYTIVDGLLATTGWHDTEMWSKVKGFTLEEGRPIPSQEQLQEISEIPAFTFIHMLHSFSEDQLQYGNKIPYDINCITLAFLVNLKYDKTWDGQKWI